MCLLGLKVGRGQWRRRQNCKPRAVRGVGATRGEQCCVISCVPSLRVAGSMPLCVTHGASDKPGNNPSLACPRAGGRGRSWGVPRHPWLCEGECQCWGTCCFVGICWVLCMLCECVCSVCVVSLAALWSVFTCAWGSVVCSAGAASGLLVAALSVLKAVGGV